MSHAGAKITATNLTQKRNLFVSPSLAMASLKPINKVVVNANERLIVEVKSADYVRLEFPGMVVGIRMEDGVLYQYQEIRPIKSPKPPTPIVDLTLPSPIMTPDEVVRAAGGHFNEVNEKHAAKLDPRICVRKLSLDFDEETSVDSVLNYDTDQSPALSYHYGDTPN